MLNEAMAVVICLVLYIIGVAAFHRMARKKREERDNIMIWHYRHMA